MFAHVRDFRLRVSGIRQRNSFVANALEQQRVVEHRASLQVTVVRKLIRRAAVAHSIDVLVGRLKRIRHLYASPFIKFNPSFVKPHAQNVWLSPNGNKDSFDLDSMTESFFHEVNRDDWEVFALSYFGKLGGNSIAFDLYAVFGELTQQDGANILVFLRQYACGPLDDLHLRPESLESLAKFACDWAPTHDEQRLRLLGQVPDVFRGHERNCAKTCNFWDFWRSACANAGFQKLYILSIDRHCVFILKSCFSQDDIDVVFF